MNDIAHRELERLLSLDEVAGYLGIPKTTLYRWRVDDQGPRAIKVGKYLRYRRDDVDVWLESNTDDRPAARTAAG